ncbi:hypothetical protein TIFTF001_014311 [Ficus carica]|uniref:Uncharacterized protein n=1 Tax=Ficus carica TaxID=3494 RepID=A0AA87ZZB4_FICCA|nr:hypothetical protein TIFTF001_014311 [Ficus carica]
MPYRDPEIYNDMYMRRYSSYVVAWHAYPHESMDHYCQREALPPEVRQFTPPSIIEMTLYNIIDAIMEAKIRVHIIHGATPEDEHPFMPVYDAGIREPVFQGGPILPEDPIPALPIQEIHLQEKEADANDIELDPADFLADPEETPEYSPVSSLLVICDGRLWKRAQWTVKLWAGHHSTYLSTKLSHLIRKLSYLDSGPNRPSADRYNTRVYFSKHVAVSIPHFTVRSTSLLQYCIRDCWQVAYLQHRPKEWLKAAVRSNSNHETQSLTWSS